MQIDRTGEVEEFELTRKILQRQADNELIARHAKRMGYTPHQITQLQTGLTEDSRAAVIANLRVIDRADEKDRIISTNLGPNRKARRRKEALKR